MSVLISFFLSVRMLLDCKNFSRVVRNKGGNFPCISIIEGRKASGKPEETKKRRENDCFVSALSTTNCAERAILNLLFLSATYDWEKWLFRNTSEMIMKSLWLYQSCLSLYNFLLDLRVCLLANHWQARALRIVVKFLLVFPSFMEKWTMIFLP